ncbi:MAG: glycoside hydrolase family 9 protein [Ruminococcus sp.]|nr:glycoside hydrolase family 9 protein [Ruminococcus sp.]
MLRKIVSGFCAAALCVTAASYPAPAEKMSADAASKQNYVEALDKSLYFYEVQQAGPLPDWNRVEWKVDSTMTDEVLGGWYDAGDHVKFNLPMAYSANMLAWGIYQYPDGVEKAGLMQTYVNNLEFVLDYLAACDKGKEIVYQVGNGTVDHTWWGPVSLLEYAMEESGTSYAKEREVLKSSKGCTAVFGEMSAALSAGYLALDGRIDETKRAAYLDHAKNIYDIAKTDPNDDVYNDTDAANFYRSRHYYDQLFYAANWLYMATKDDSYLKDAKSYLPKLDKMLGDTEKIAYGWCHCWDDNLQGAMLLYAINTGEQERKDHVKRHLQRWLDGKEEPWTIDGGLRWLTDWGSLRYANTAAFLAEVASDTIFAGEDTSAYRTFAEQQVNYALGDNPDNFSYLIGYGDNYPSQPHHRTAHGSWKNDEKTPVNTRHILYGGLVGGPDKTGGYVDERGKYVYVEVATDYNAGFTAMLCKMVDQYGGTKDPNFPPKEVHDSPEFYVEASTNGATSGGITVSFKITNHSAWPARVQDNISFRYYMDLSEVGDPQSISVACYRDQATMYSGVSPVEISKPIQYSGNIYYVEAKLPDGRAVLPISEGRQQCEILLAFQGNNWDASNDFSNKDILGAAPSAGGQSKGVIAPHIPVYVNGELYYGYEPDGTFADGLGSTGSDDPKTTTSTTTTSTITTTTTTAPTNEDNILWGDANCDDQVNMADAVLIMQSIGNPDKYGKGTDDGITEKGEKNADVFNTGDGVTNKDALSIQKYKLGIITELPEKK